MMAIAFHRWTRAIFVCLPGIGLIPPALAVDMSCNGVQRAQQQQQLAQNPQGRAQYDAALQKFDVQLKKLREQAKAVEAQVSLRVYWHINAMLEADPKAAREVVEFVKRNRPEVYAGALQGIEADKEAYLQIAGELLHKNQRSRGELEVRVFRDPDFLAAKTRDLALQREAHKIEADQAFVRYGIPPQEAQRALVTRSLSDRYIQSPTLSTEQRATLAKAVDEIPVLRELLATAGAGERAKSRDLDSPSLQPAISDSRLVFDSSALGSVAEAVKIQRDTIRLTEAARLEAKLDLRHVTDNYTPRDKGLRQELMQDQTLPLSRDVAKTTAKAVQALGNVERTYDSITRVIPPPPPTTPAESAAFQDWMKKGAEKVVDAASNVNRIFILDSAKKP